MEYKKSRSVDRGGSHGKRDSYRDRADRHDSPAHNYKEPDENVVIGRNAVKELLSGERDVEKLFVAKGDKEGSINQILGIAAERGIPITECDRSRLDVMAAGGRHQGVVAIAAERKYSSPKTASQYAEYC